MMLLLGIISAVQVYAMLPHRPQVPPPLDGAGVFLTVFGALTGGVYLGRYFAVKGRA
jgi:hypothetical protein